MHQLLRRNPYVIVGIFGLVLIGLSLSLGAVVSIVPTASLLLWQVASGCVLTLLLAYQWVLMFVRVFGGNKLLYYKAHRWVGVAATVLFALHALSFGYGWTNTLALVFCLSAVTGILNREVITYRKAWVYRLWYWSHITLSLSLLPLIVVHIWVALAYEGGLSSVL